MKNENRCKITIFGDEYTLVTNEPIEHVVQAAHMVDSFMQEVAKASAGTASDKKVAVLASLRLASTLLGLENAQEKEKRRNEYIIERIDHVLRPIVSS